MANGTQPSMSRLNSELNLFEQIVAQVSPTDEWLQAILQATTQPAVVGGGGQGDVNITIPDSGDEASPSPETMAMLQNAMATQQLVRQRALTTGGVRREANQPGGDYADPQKGALPADVIGIVATDIQPGDFGPAVFQLNGTVIFARVTNTKNQTLSSGEPVRTIGGDNEVTDEGVTIGPSELLGGGTGGQTGTTVVSPDELIQVQNEYWSNNGTRLNPSVNNATFSGDLQPGDDEVVARVESARTNIGFEIRGIGSTSHVGDVDGDGDDESVIRYYYEYQGSPGATWEEVPGIGGTSPLGDMANLSPVLENGALGPVYGFRIRFLNRTNNTASAFTVGEEDLGSRIAGRVVQS